MIKNIIEGELFGLRQFLATEIPFKNIEKCFLFHLKKLFLFSFSRYLNFCLDVLVV